MTREQAQLIVEDLHVEAYLYELADIGMNPSDSLVMAYCALIVYAEGVEGP